jgi:hypothetical protein
MTVKNQNVGTGRETDRKTKIWTGTGVGMMRVLEAEPRVGATGVGVNYVWRGLDARLGSSCRQIMSRTRHLQNNGTDDAIYETLPRTNSGCKFSHVFKRPSFLEQMTIIGAV